MFIRYCRTGVIAGLALAIVAAVASPPAVAETGRPVGPNPIPAPIAKGPIRVALQDVVRLPVSMKQGAPSRPHVIAAARDGSGRMFIADQYSRLFVMSGDGKLRGWPALDLYVLLKGRFFSDVWEGGLSAFAIHPDSARGGARGYAILYTVHTEKATGPVDGEGGKVFRSPSGKVHHVSVLTEWRFNSHGFHETSVDRRRVLIKWEQPEPDHEVGGIAFNPTARRGDPDYGTLYIGVGDGGNTQQPKVEPFRVAQRLDTAFGKILRIRPTPRRSSRYVIPGDNPFVGRKGALPEIWAYGLRNPQTFSWDRQTGRMYIADIGEFHIEEVNLGVKGANYGWSLRQGRFRSLMENSKTLLSLPADDAAQGFTYPVAMYDHDEGYAIGGGFVYRGKAIPALVGKYVFTDVPTGRFFYFDTEGLEPGRPAKIMELVVVYKGKVQPMKLVVGNLNRVDLRLGEGPDGELYAITKQDGMVRKLVPAK